MDKTDTTQPIQSIRQKQGWFTTVEFTLFADRLQVITNNLFGSSLKFLYFGTMKEETDKLSRRSVFRFISSLVFILPGILSFFPLFANPHGNGTLFALTLGIPMLLIGLHLIYTGIRRWHCKQFVFFYTYHEIQNQPPTPVPLHYLDAYPTNCDEVEKFIHEKKRLHKNWTDRIESLQSAMAGKSEAEMLKKFASLHDRQILTDEEFLEIKDKILSGAKRQMGFGPANRG